MQCCGFPPPGPTQAVGRASGDYPSSGGIAPTPLVLKPPLIEKQFDEDYYWYLVELDVRAEHAEGTANAAATDFVLMYLQHLQPQYTAGPWPAYTPPFEDALPSGVKSPVVV